ncbi:NAD(+) diphosphatase [Cognatiyoonia sp. IB215446]|uniref:NAD(+) diphosphatase n=1 Tax=Cognatiyoonia sp. IB215446 TaxID=3097355 RepID=UPI002A103C6F|nr:NAD(+) diphosphatase [Cognatiyoonia sp. IB215446]MDX8347196.1 NAD(+) diphosphatase [Cognatiyoonia sp. IB215446]
MKIAETVTFGGAALNRATERRAEIDQLIADPAAKTILQWRGKPMVANGTLVQVPLDHPVLDDASRERVLLCNADTGPVLATDMSDWTPPDGDAADLNSFLDRTQQHHPSVPNAVFAELRGIMTQLSPADAELAVTAKAVLGWHQTHRFCAVCGHESVMAMAGWQRDCPACGHHHFPRTDPVVIMLITYGNAVLVGRSPGWPEGMYSLLAGFAEPGETVEAAVRREVFEEVGVRVGPVRYLASQPWPFPASLMLGCAGEALGTELTIDPNEIEDALWVSREEMAQAFAGTHPKILPARKGAIAHFLLRAWLADRLDE